MNILLKSVNISDPSSSHYNSIKDILISDGKIKSIEDNIESKNKKFKIIDCKGKHLSQGWVDLKADFCDPGNEYKETIESGLKAAAAGGYTHVCVLPSTNPFVDGKTQVEYILRKSESSLTKAHPIGSITKKGKGKELSEMYDMNLSGTRLFSDDLNEVSTGMLSRSLLYSKNINATIISLPKESSLSNQTIVNEGLASLKTGLKGDPSISEEIEIEKNLSVLQYTQGKLHLTGISTKKGVEKIKKAKTEGANLTASVNIMNVLFDENEVLNFDTNFKIIPPLRTKEDKEALLKGLKDGTIDAIDSDHRPHEQDEKDVDFQTASFGCIQLQTTFAAFNTFFPKNTALFIEAVSIKAKNTAQIKEQAIEVGNEVDATLYDPQKEWKMEKKEILSKSFNTPFLNKNLKGKVCAVFRGNKILEF